MLLQGKIWNKLLSILLATMLIMVPVLFAFEGAAAARTMQRQQKIPQTRQIIWVNTTTNAMSTPTVAPRTSAPSRVNQILNAAARRICNFGVKAVAKAVTKKGAICVITNERSGVREIGVGPVCVAVAHQQGKQFCRRIFPRQ